MTSKSNSEEHEVIRRRHYNNKHFKRHLLLCAVSLYDMDSHYSPQLPELSESKLYLTS